MPWSSEDWWGDWYWNYHTWRWEWGGDWSAYSQPTQNLAAPAASSHTAGSARDAASAPNAAAAESGDPLPNEAVQDADETDGWIKPDVLEEADATYRIRTLKPTPMEYDTITDAFKDNDGALKYLTRVMKHWGKGEVYNDCKALLSMLAASQPFAVGEAAVPGTAAFALSKCMVASQRVAPAAAEGDGGCFCLPMVFLGGCRHKPSIITPRKGLQDTMCHHCSKCIRCQGFPSCIFILSKCHPCQCN